MTKLMKQLEELPSGFSQPTALPVSADQERNWQDANRGWWESHPMRYDWKGGIPYEEFSEEFYAEIDKRFSLLSSFTHLARRFPSTGL